MGVESGDLRTNADPSNPDTITDGNAPPHADPPTDANAPADTNAPTPADPHTNPGANARPYGSADPSSHVATGCRGQRRHVAGHRSTAGGGLSSGGGDYAHTQARERRGHG